MKNKDKSKFICQAIALISLLFYLFLSDVVIAQPLDGGGYEPSNPIPLAKKPRGMEITSKRTLKSKTYLNPDNTVSVIISNGYMHYQDVDSKFKEIQRRLVPIDSTTFGVTEGLYEAFFKLNPDTVQPFEIKLKDNASLSWQLLNLVYYETSSKKYQPIYTLQVTQPVTDENTITYPEIFPGIDLKLIYEDTRVKEEIHLSQSARKQLPLPESFGMKPQNTYLMFLAQIGHDPGIEPYAGKEKIKEKEFEGSKKIDFKDKKGRIKFFFPIDWAFLEQDRDNPFAEYYKMHKRTFCENNKMFVMAGIKYKKLEDIPDGTLIFDPTTSIQPPPSTGKDSRFGHNGSSSAELKNYGAHSVLQIHTNKYSSNYYGGRTVIQFDLNNIPQNAAIESADLLLYDYSHAGLFRDANSHDAHIHEISRSWIEGTGLGTQTNDGVDYQRYDGTNYWTNDGGDYDATVLDAVTFYKDDYNRWQEFDVTSSVQNMVNGTKSNYGWIIKWDVDIGSNRVDANALFYSSDYTTDVTRRPYLEITYQIDPIISFDYDALSRVSKATFANGVEETNQYDTNRGWLTRRDYKRDGTNMYYFNSTGANDFDKAGNLKRIEYKHKSDAAETMDYSYDNLYRITQFKHNSSVSQNYDYDPNGNLITLTGKTLSYGNDNNQLTGDGSRTFHFDAAGRVDQINSTTLGYDFRNNMVSHGSNSYTYDPFSQRIRKTESGTSKYYITSGQQVLAEYTTNSEPDAEYIYALGRMIAKYDPDQGYLWFYVDHLNSARLVDGSDQGQTDMRRDYYPYGEAYTASGNDQTAYQFTQKELDNGTGFYYFGARYYDPSIGRWFVPDPIGQGFSPYIYCANSPLNYIDREGKFWELIAGALIFNWAINTFNEKGLGNNPGGAPPSMSQMGTFQPQMPGGVLKDYFYGDPSVQAGINSAFYFYNRNFGWLPSYKRPPLFLTPQDQWAYNSRVVGKTAGFLWSLPNTLIGFSYVGVHKLITGKPRYIGFDEENWVWGFENVPFFNQYGMITFGHVVSAHDEWGYGGFNNFTYANHELIHVMQNDIWGPTFFPIYISNWAVNMGLMFAGFNIRPYRDILFERQAYSWENSINRNLWYYFNPNPRW